MFRCAAVRWIWTQSQPPAGAPKMSEDARPVARPAVDAKEARPWSDFVHRVYADLRLSRGWGEPTAVTIPALQLTALCGSAPGEAVQLVVPFSTQRSLCTEELDAVLAEAAAVGALTAVLAMQDDTSAVVGQDGVVVHVNDEKESVVGGQGDGLDVGPSLDGERRGRMRLQVDDLHPVRNRREQDVAGAIVDDICPTRTGCRSCLRRRRVTVRRTA